MQPQYPIEPVIDVDPPKVKSVKYFDGRRLCTDDRLIEMGNGYDAIAQDNVDIAINTGKVVAWYRESPVTLRVEYHTGFLEIHVFEPEPLNVPITAVFCRYGSGRNTKLHMSSFKTTERDRIKNRVMDLLMQSGEFMVSIVVDGSVYRCYEEHYRNEAAWKITGPSYTRNKVNQDLVKNFNEVMEAIAHQLNCAKADNFIPSETAYRFYVWDECIAVGNMERVRKALEQTGWTVLELENSTVGITVKVK